MNWKCAHAIILQFSERHTSYTNKCDGARLIERYISRILVLIIVLEEIVINDDDERRSSSRSSSNKSKSIRMKYRMVISTLIFLDFNQHKMNKKSNLATNQSKRRWRSKLTKRMNKIQFDESRSTKLQKKSHAHIFVDRQGEIFVNSSNS